ncbi:MAG: FMN-binding negative transcriptional regulator [Burkholderiaceae bacterium]
MYQPAHYVQADRAIIDGLIARHPFATLIMQTPAGLEVNHLPLLQVAGAGGAGSPALLQGHLARANGAWKQLGNGAPVLAVFHGEQQYITPSWYAGKAEHGKVVPTWNYEVVHVHGTARAIDDRAWVGSLVTRLTDNFERTRDKPWAVDDAPADYLDMMMKAIVGIEIRIERIEAKSKLGQNQPPANRASLREGLAREGHAAMAARIPPGPPA